VIAKQNYVNNVFCQFTCSLLIMVFSKDKLSVIVSLHTATGCQDFKGIS